MRYTTPAIPGELFYSQVACAADCPAVIPSVTVTLCDMANPVCPTFPNGPGVCQGSVVLPPGYYVCNAP
jgi:hypothetical protein